MTKGRDCSAASYFSPGEAEKSEEVTHQNAQFCLGPSRRNPDRPSSIWETKRSGSGKRAEIEQF